MIFHDIPRSAIRREYIYQFLRCQLSQVRSNPIPILGARSPLPPPYWPRQDQLDILVDNGSTTLHICSHHVSICQGSEVPGARAKFQTAS
ncbi:hypothetical protein I7I48_03087 [Histoplasma ohiense]|nr:hypothetical protein I7I48_03087 [Histoplasma ohiense (nom. inval.)]